MKPIGGPDTGYVRGVDVTSPQTLMVGPQARSGVVNELIEFHAKRHT